jgi:drug/metabolite transporter (DMT)-like permease
MNAPSESSGTAAKLVGPGALLVLLTAVISGISTFVNGFAVAGTNSDAFVTVRNVTVALLLVPIVLATARVSPSPRLRRTDWGRLVTIGIIGGGIPFLLFFRGLELAAAAGGALTASFLYRTLFVMAAALGIVVLGERFHWRIAAAAALLLAGNLILLSLTSPIWTDGSLYVLAATALWAAEYTVSKRSMGRLSSGTVALGRMGFGAIFLVGYLAVTSQFASVAALSGAQWEWVAISAILLTGFVTTWYAGLRRTELGVATSVLVLGFPVTWLLEVALLGSHATAPEIAGAAVIAVGAGVALGRTTLGAAWRFVRDSFALRSAA